MNITDNENRIHILNRTAKEVKQYLTVRRILKAALSVLVTVVIILYIVAVLYKRTGSFTVSLDKFDMAQKGLSLSESRTMQHASSHLNANIVEEITNISVSSLPMNLDKIDGEHNGENYIAYTFYLKNGGEQTQDYEYALILSNITQDLDEAIRIRLYLNGESEDYARTSSDGSGPEPGTREFYSDLVVVQDMVGDFEPGEVHKFTVVIWIEGDDPDCIDDLIGGKLRAEMKFTTLR